MAMTFVEALRYAVKTTGKSVRSIAAAADIPYDRLKQVHGGRTASTNADDALKIAHAFGVSFEDFIAGNLSMRRTVSIAGRVGAGARVPVFDAYEKGDGPQVEAPPALPATGVVAVEIEGDSMEPIFEDGDLLFYSRVTADGVPDDVIGHPCVVEDADGMGWVKQCKRGDEPGLFHLVSLNPGAQTMWNVRLKWAARVRLHWPADLARRV